MNTYKFRIWSYKKQDFLPTKDGLDFQEDLWGQEDLVPATDLMNNMDYSVQLLIGADGDGNDVYTQDILKLKDKTFLVSDFLTPKQLRNSKKLGDFRDLDDDDL